MPHQKIKTKQLKDMVERQDYRCALTGRELNPDTASADHIQPVSKGGSHTIENIQILHSEVNAAKGTMNNDEFVSMCREVVQHVGGGGLNLYSISLWNHI